MPERDLQESMLNPCITGTTAWPKDQATRDQGIQCNYETMRKLREETL